MIVDPNTLAWVMASANGSSVLRRNNVHIRGTGDRALVFVNGFGCGQETWRHIAPSFERDFVTVVFDHVGAGRSQLTAYSSDRYSSFAAYSADLVEIGQELNLRHAAIVGHSCGAMIAALASTHERSMFDRLVMIGPSARYLDDGAYIGGFSGPQVHDMLDLLHKDPKVWSLRMAPLFMGNPDKPELSDELIESFLRLDPTVASDFARVIFESDVRDQLAGVTARSLILQCKDDCLAPSSAGAYVHSRLTDSVLVQMNARGHFPHMSAPRDTVTAIGNFLRAGPRSDADTPSALIVRRKARRLALVRQGVELLGASQRSRTQTADVRDDGALDSLLARLGELWMHLGRYDMHALSLQNLLTSHFEGEASRFTLRTRGPCIARMLGRLDPELSAHFAETQAGLAAILDRHEISARRGASIFGLWDSSAEVTGMGADVGRDWFDQVNASAEDCAHALEQVERDILKVVSLCFRITHCALAAQRKLLNQPSAPASEG